MLRWIFDSLSRRADQSVNSWFKSSTVKDYRRNSLREKIIRWMSEHPFLYLGLVWLLAVLVSLLSLGCFLIPQKYGVVLFTFSKRETDFLAYFGTLWSIQATIAAMVYPIVIAFVAVLLQRRSTAEISLRLYYGYAAVVPAGLSALFLVGWMGLEYFLIPYSESESIAAVMVGNMFWFAINVASAATFLHRTLKYLDDGVRLEVLKDFAINVAFPREVRTNELGNIFANAVALKILPGETFGSVKFAPQVLLFPYRHGTVCIEISGMAGKVITDVRFRLLRHGISRWLRKARNHVVTKVGNQHKQPMMMIPVAVGEAVNNKVVLCRIQNGPAPDKFASFLIRHSVVFGNPIGRSLSFTCNGILEELRIEALMLAEQKRYESARETINALADLHAGLIKSGAYANENGNKDNAALSPSPYGFGSRPIHEGWLQVYSPLAEEATRSLAINSTLYDRHCYLLNRLSYELKGEHLDILISLLHISTHLMYRLNGWWSAQIEERGVAIHDCEHAATLLPPQSGTYERALKKFIEGWEVVDLWNDEIMPPNAESAWQQHTRYARFTSAQLENMTRMILKAVSIGDKAAALWLIDSFLKWWERNQYRFHIYQGYGNKHSRLTLTCIHLSWNDVRKQLEATPEGQQEISLAGEVMVTVLHRYWLDLRLVMILLLLDWTSTANPQESFSFELAAALLQGKNLRQGEENSAEPLTDPAKVHFRLLRIELGSSGYSAMLNHIISFAQELRRPEMIAMRIYGGSGADDIQSLCMAQIQMLVALANAACAPHPDVVKLAQGLIDLERMKYITNQLLNCATPEIFAGKSAVALALQNAIGGQANVEDARVWVNSMLAQVVNTADNVHNETLEAAHVSQARLDLLAKATSDYVLGSDNEVFPFTLTPKFHPVQNAGEPRFLPFTGVRKAPFTEPPLEAWSDSTASLYTKHIANAVGASIVSKYLDDYRIEALRGTSENEFFEDMSARATTLREVGLTPLLLVPPQGGPRWVYPWYHRSAEQTDALSVRLPKSEDPASIISYVNEIPAHKLPIYGKNCYLVAKEDFEDLQYSSSGAESCMSVTAIPQEKFTLELKFEWAFAVKPDV